MLLVFLVLHKVACKKYLLLNHPFQLVACMPKAIRLQPLADRDLRQVNILHYGPDDGQTTGFRREGVNLIGALSHIAKEALDGVGRANVAMHDRWERIKRQKMLFIFTEAADGFGIALLVFGLKGCQIPEAHPLSSPA